MNKQEMIEILKAEGLDKKDCVVVMGGALLLHGLREESHDIDINVSQETYQSFLDRGYETDLNAIGRHRILVMNGENEIEIFDDGIAEVEYEEIDGVYVQTLESILNWKRILNREKDQKDIEVITSILNQG